MSSVRAALVTVGTTKFDALVAACDTREFADALREIGIERLRVQYGSGEMVPTLSHAAAVGIEASSFAFSDDFQSEIDACDVVIGHAGAGTAMETLRSGRRLVMVVNAALMDNHQSELAHALVERGHALIATVETLPEVLRAAKWGAMVPLPPRDARPFLTALHKLCGIPLRS